MKFVLSYSFGKDSSLALHRMLSEGHTPVALLVMVNEEQKRSYFHGADYNMMNAVSNCLQIPIIFGKSAMGDYNEVIEDCLKKAVALGAEVAVFGDIDISDHKTWADERCANAGVKTHFPLWHLERRAILDELLDNDFCCIIKSINNEKLPRELLGKKIDKAMIKQFEEHGIDICGEYGEYHTLVVDGPIFKNKLCYVIKEQLDFGVTSVVDIAVDM